MRVLKPAQEFLFGNFCYFSSPQFSPAFSEPPSPWIGSGSSDMTPDTISDVVATPAVTSSYSQRSTEKMKADEALGNGATISAVLYANMNHPEWQTEYPVWADRYKQILKKWRALSADKKAPYLQQARDNRSAFRMKKTQQVRLIFCFLHTKFLKLKIYIFGWL